MRNRAETLDNVQNLMFVKQKEPTTKCHFSQRALKERRDPCCEV